jgi:hypothetical protein
LTAQPDRQFGVSARLIAHGRRMVHGVDGRLPAMDSRRIVAAVPASIRR